MSKKKILVLYQDWGNWFIDDYSIFEHWFKEKDRAYDKNNDYYVFSLSFHKRNPFKKEKNVTVELFKSTPTKQFIDLIEYSKRLTEIINEFKPDIIYSSFLYLLSCVPRNSKVRFKTIGFLRDKTAEMVKSQGGIRYIVGNIFYLLDYIALKKIDLVLNNGKSMEKYAKKLGYNKEIIYNPREITDKEFYEKSKPYEKMLKLKNNGCKIILSVGRLVKGKNMLLAVKTLSYLPKNYHLFIVGDGEEKEELKKFSKKLKVSKRVHLIGYVKHKDLWQYYKGADLFYLLSKTEGTPNVLQEAMYAKVPIIASKISAMKNIIDNNVNGIILNTFNPNELAEKTQDLLNNKNQIKYITNNGIKKINLISKKNKPVTVYFN